MAELNSLTDFNSFSNYLNTVRDNGGILNLEEVKKAKIIAESLVKKNDIPHALDYLKSETTKYGSIDAKHFYSYGAELKLSTLLDAIKENEKQEFIKSIFSGKAEITIPFVKKLPEEIQNKIINLAGEAAAYFKELAKNKRSARPPEEYFAIEILNFINYIQDLDM